jgi:hypothetical protein
MNRSLAAFILLAALPHPTFGQEPPPLPENDPIVVGLKDRGIDDPIAVIVARADGDHEFFLVEGRPVQEQNLSTPEVSIQRGSSVICTKYGCFKVD